MNDAKTARMATKQARDFRRLVRKLFEIGPPEVILRGKAGELEVLAAFGGHPVLLGGFAGSELDDVLRLVMKVRAAAPGGFQSAALAEAFQASGPIEGGAAAEVEV